MTLECTPHLPLTPSAVPGPYRVADYMGFEGEERVELIHGRLYVVPSPSNLHQVVVVRLIVLLSAIADPRGATVLVAPSDLVVADHSVLQPDVSYLSEENRTTLKGPTTERPDLVIEVVSPTSSRRERMAKKPLYAARGIPEYWIVDPQEKVIDFLVLDGDSYRSVDLNGSVYVSPVQPEIQLNVEGLWQFAYAKLRSGEDEFGEDSRTA